MHKETTEDIRVTVIPFYMGFRQGYISISIKVWNNLKLGLISGRTSKTMCSGGDIASGM